MDFQTLQDAFGKEPAKIYVFDGEIPDDANKVEYITATFVEDAGTNLVTCVVSEIQNVWFLYTKETFDLSDKFRLVAELPLPEIVEPEPEEV